MDLNLLRSLSTVAAFVAFVGIVLWAMSGRRRADFDAAAQLPLDDDASARPFNGASGEKQ